MKIKTYIPLIITSSLCCANSSPNATIRSHNIHNLTMNNEIQLGSGYFTNALYPIHNQCIKNMPVKITGFRSNLALTHSTNTDTLSKNLNIDLKAKAGWGKFSSNAAAEYIKSIQSDEYSSSFTYHNVITVDTLLDTSEYYGEQALNAGGLAAYQNGTDQFIKRCGDKYVQGIQMGAVLNVTLRIHFASQLEKKNFEASIEGKLGDLFNASAKINSAVNHSRAHGSIDVIAYQAGGSPNYLSGIFGADNNHAITKCNLSQLDECAKAIDDIISYAQATGKWETNGFAKQVQIVNKELVAESLVPVAISEATFGSYESDFGLDSQFKPVSEDILQARKKLNDLFDKINHNYGFAKSLLESTGYKYLSDPAQQRLHSIVRIIESNLALFNSERAIDCFLPGSQEQCKAIADIIEKKIDTTDITPINLLKGAYFVNISRNWPAILVKNNNGSMDFYNTNLIPVGTITHDLKITPSYDFQYVSLGGGYSTYYNGKQTRYYMDYYGIEDILYKNFEEYSYVGSVPWNTCVAGKCSKISYYMEIVPF